MAVEYSASVIDHFINPRNVGKLENPDGEGTCGDPACGDYLSIYIKVKDEIIEDISFLVYGCAGAIATSSVTTVLAKGKTLAEAKKITESDVIKALGGLPEVKLHCSLLGIEALRKSIADYYRKKA
ncbi:MAG TPA: iron-sulfur cluster assembly scaffold protein [Firmicutes bacterium]|nr:iron-sulfur cluster assembly scaffold protein [Bacillota bacterium]